MAAKRLRIQAREATESDLTDDLIEKLSKLSLAAGVLGGTPTGNGTDAATIASGIGAAAAIDSIKNSLISILSELVNTKAFADILVQDSVNNYFVRRESVDQSTGQFSVEFLTLSNLPGIPIGAVVPIKNGGSDSILENKYYVKAAGTGFSVGDSLSNVRVVDGETEAITSLGWFNITTGQLLAGIPAQSAIAGYEDVIEEQLTKIVSLLPSSLGAKTTAQSLSVTLPIDAVLPLPSGLAKSILQEATNTILSAIDVSVNSLLKPSNTLTAIGTISSPLPSGGNTLGKVGIDPGNNTVVANIGSIGTLATAALQGTGNTSLSAIDAKLGANLAADILAIRNNTAKISQFSFQLAKDSTGTVFLIKTDIVAGMATNIDVATGLPFTPTGAIELTDPTASALQLEPNEFEAITNSAGNWSIGDVLTRVLIVNTSTNTVSATIWQSSTGTTLTTIPSVGVDVIDTDRQQTISLRSIDDKLTVANIRTLTPTDIVTVVLPATASTSALQAAGNTAIDLVNTKLTKPNMLPIVNGTIAAANTSQELLPPRIGRQYVEVLATAVDIWINIGTAAGLNVGIKISPSSQSWFSPPQLLVEGTVNIWSATAGVQYIAIEG